MRIRPNRALSVAVAQIRGALEELSHGETSPLGQLRQTCLTAGYDPAASSLHPCYSHPLGQTAMSVARASGEAHNGQSFTELPSPHAFVIGDTFRRHGLSLDSFHCGTAVASPVCGGPQVGCKLLAAVPGWGPPAWIEPDDADWLPADCVAHFLRILPDAARVVLHRGASASRLEHADLLLRLGGAPATLLDWLDARLADLVGYASPPRDRMNPPSVAVLRMGSHLAVVEKAEGGTVKNLPDGFDWRWCLAPTPTSRP